MPSTERQVTELLYCETPFLKGITEPNQTPSPDRVTKPKKPLAPYETKPYLVVLLFFRFFDLVVLFYFVLGVLLNVLYPAFLFLYPTLTKW